MQAIRIKTTRKWSVPRREIACWIHICFPNKRRNSACMLLAMKLSLTVHISGLLYATVSFCNIISKRQGSLRWFTDAFQCIHDFLKINILNFKFWFQCVYSNIYDFDFYVVTEFTTESGFIPCGYFSRVNVLELFFFAMIKPKLRTEILWYISETAHNPGYESQLFLCISLLSEQGIRQIPHRLQ